MMLFRTLRVASHTNGVRALATGNHWSNMGNMIPESKKLEWGTKLADMSKRTSLATAQSQEALGEVDWAAYEKILGKDAVAKVRQEYSSYKYTDFSKDAAEEKASLKATESDVLASISQTQSDMNVHLGAAKEQLAELEATRTNAETDYDSVAARFPDIEAELEADLAKHNYDNEVDAVDVNAARVALIQERWDTKAFGTLDEDTQREFLDEITAMEKRQASGHSVTAGDVSDEQLAYFKKEIESRAQQAAKDESAYKAVGATFKEMSSTDLKTWASSLTKDNVASILTEKKISTEDLALTKTSELIAKVDEYLEINNGEFKDLEMAGKLLERMQELANRGKLEPLTAEQESAMAKASQSIVTDDVSFELNGEHYGVDMTRRGRFSFAELEGLTSEELAEKKSAEVDMEVKLLIELYSLRNKKSFNKYCTDLDGDGAINKLYHEIMDMREEDKEVQNAL